MGVGDTGSKITLDIVKKTDVNYLLLKNKKSDKDNSNNIIIDTPNLINPPISRIRHSLYLKKEEIISKVKDFNSIIIIGNLSSKFGMAVLPIITQFLRNLQIEIICMVILPFGFEKEKIFRCGTALSFLQIYSDSVIIIDNDMFLRNNIDSNVYDCYEITNSAIKDIIILFFEKHFPDKLNIISSSKTKEKLENMLIEILNMVTDKIDPNKIKQTFMYIFPSKENFDNIQTVVESTRKLLDKSDVEVNFITKNKDTLKMHLVISTQQNLYDSYDPLKIIPQKNVLDFEPEISLSNSKDIQLLKNIEF